MVSPDLRNIGSWRESLGHNRRLFPGGSGPPTLAPGDQFKTPVARASVPVVMLGLWHDDAPSPPREHGRIRRLQPRPECGSAVTLTVYCLNFGLCSRYSIGFGRPEGRREFRLYFVERIFDYSPIIRRFLNENQEIRCSKCDATFGVEQLNSLQLYSMSCPECREGVCEVINLSKKH